MACLHPPEKVKLGNFTLESCINGKEMYKKVRCTCKVVVLPTKSVLVFDAVVAVASLDLKVPSEVLKGHRQLLHMRIRYHFLAVLRITRYEIYTVFNQI